MKQRLRRASRFLFVQMKKLDFSVFSDARKRLDPRCGPEIAVRSILVGLLCGCRSLLDVERLLGRVEPKVKAKLRTRGRLADTTLRDWLCRLSHESARQVLHQVVRTAHTAKALVPVGLPFGVLSMDGKATALPSWDSPFAQRHSPAEGLPYGLLRTVTSVLVSARGNPVLDVVPIPAATNEMGFFRRAFDAVHAVSGHLFRLVCYDAGANSEENARHVVAAGKDYLFCMNNAERHMEQEAKELLEYAQVAAAVDAVESGKRLVRREIRLYSVNRGLLAKGKKVSVLWEHCHTLVALTTRRSTRDGESCDTRYFCASLPVDALRPEQWIEVIVRRWGVETAHQILDVGFAEDDKPWTPYAPDAALVVMVLRRAAYTLITLYRHVTLKAERFLGMSWREFLRWLSDALIRADAAMLAPRGQRNRRVASATL